MSPRVRPNRTILAVLFLVLIPFVAVETVGVVLFALVIHINRSQTGAATLAQLLMVTVLRALCLVVYARWRDFQQVIQINYRFPRRSAIMVAASIPLAFLISNNFEIPSGYHPQVVQALHYSTTQFGEVVGVPVTVAQYLYYASEGILLVFLTDAFQALAEAHSLRPEIPWGGLGLALTWGLLHISTKGFLVAIAAVVTGLVVGVLYLLTSRSIWAPFAIWMVVTII